MNLLSGSTWKGAKLRFGEAKPDFKERCTHCWLSFMIQNSYIHTYISRIALENKVADEEPLFDDNDDNSVHPESVESDIDVDDEPMKDDAMLVDDDEDDGIEVMPIDIGTAGTTKLQNDEEEEENDQETGNPLARVTSTKSTELKDLFAPREEDGKYFQFYCN
jgi:hypothetical protein